MTGRMTDEEFASWKQFPRGTWYPLYVEARRARESEGRLRRALQCLADQVGVLAANGRAPMIDETALIVAVDVLDQAGAR